jgi:hypothetical protein
MNVKHIATNPCRTALGAALWLGAQLTFGCGSCPSNAKMIGSTCVPKSPDAGTQSNGTTEYATDSGAPENPKGTTGNAPNGAAGSRGNSTGSGGRSSVNTVGASGTAGKAADSQPSRAGGSADVGAPIGGSSAGSMMQGSPTTAGSAAPPQSSPAAGSAAPPQSSTPTAGSAAPPPNQSTCTPTAEQCDNIDNDCDGKIDEEVTPMPCGSNIGTCKQGTVTCHAGKFDGPATQCQGAVGPSVEVCDEAMQDENCDGTSNENCACTDGMTKACGNANPPCKQGTQTCMNGMWSATCAGQVMGTSEVCDGIDNDCDGTPDNGDDALCQAGQHCAGTALCVQCKATTDCASSNNTCAEAYCNTSHQCATQTHVDHTACTLPGAAGICSEGTCISGCIDDSDCKTASASHCNPATRACVACVNNNDAQCPSGTTCSSDNSCVPSCGNGRLDTDLREACDASDGKDNEWNCDSQCNRLFIYTPCQTQAPNSAECGGGTCTNLGGSIGVACLPSCGASTSGTTCSEPNGQDGFCLGGCLVRCDTGTNRKCPPGTTCTAVTTTAIQPLSVCE